MSDTYCRHDNLISSTTDEFRCLKCEFEDDPDEMVHRFIGLERENARLKNLVGDEDSEVLDFDRSGLKQIRDWVKKTRAEVDARGNLFDCLFRCVAEGGEVFTVDAEEIERLVDEHEARGSQLCALMMDIERAFEWGTVRRGPASTADAGINNVFLFSQGDEIKALEGWIELYWNYLPALMLDLGRVLPRMRFLEVPDQPLMPIVIDCDDLTKWLEVETMTKQITWQTASMEAITKMLSAMSASPLEPEDGKP